MARTKPWLNRVDRKTTSWIALQFDEEATTTADIRPVVSRVMDRVDLPEGWVRRASAYLFARPRLSLALLLGPPLLWLGVVYLGTLAALLVQSLPRPLVKRLLGAAAANRLRVSDG